jgi:hypothetical protein
VLPGGPAMPIAWRSPSANVSPTTPPRHPPGGSVSPYISMTSGGAAPEWALAPAAARIRQEGGMLSLILLKLTAQSVLADIPRDTGAVVTYGLLVLFIGFVIAGSRGEPRVRGSVGEGDE